MPAGVSALVLPAPSADFAPNVRRWLRTVVVVLAVLALVLAPPPGRAGWLSNIVGAGAAGVVAGVAAIATVATVAAGSLTAAVTAGVGAALTPVALTAAAVAGVAAAAGSLITSVSDNKAVGGGVAGALQGLATIGVAALVKAAAGSAVLPSLTALTFSTPALPVILAVVGISAAVGAVAAGAQSYFNNQTMSKIDPNSPGLDQAGQALDVAKNYIAINFLTGLAASLAGTFLGLLGPKGTAALLLADGIAQMSNAAGQTVAGVLGAISDAYSALAGNSGGNSNTNSGSSDANSNSNQSNTNTQTANNGNDTNGNSNSNQSNTNTQTANNGNDTNGNSNSNQPNTNTQAANNNSNGTNQGNTNQPNTNQGNTNQPNTNQPNTNQPNTNKPITNQPNTNKPVTNQPDTNQGDTSSTSGNQTSGIITCPPEGSIYQIPGEVTPTLKTYYVYCDTPYPNARTFRIGIRYVTPNGVDSFQPEPNYNYVAPGDPPPPPLSIGSSPPAPVCTSQQLMDMGGIIGTVDVAKPGSKCPSGMVFAVCKFSQPMDFQNNGKVTSGAVGCLNPAVSNPAIWCTGWANQLSKDTKCTCQKYGNDVPSRATIVSIAGYTYAQTGKPVMVPMNLPSLDVGAETIAASECPPTPASAPTSLGSGSGTITDTPSAPAAAPQDCAANPPYLPWGGTGWATIAVSGGKPCSFGWHDTPGGPGGVTILDSMTVTSPPSHGTLKPQDQHVIIFTPAPGYKGSDSFTLSMREHNGSRSATLSVKVSVIIQ